MRTILAAGILLSATGAWAAPASEPGLAPLQEAAESARAKAAALNAERAQAEALVEPLVHSENFGSLPQPDAKTLAWLSSRIPGLDPKAVRSVPTDVAAGVLDRAVAAKATYLDVFTNDAFRKNEAYYVPQDSLNALSAKYISGTLPVQGKDENGKPFQMQALLIGQGRVQILYDRSDFVFKDAKNKFKVQNGGRVESGILAAGDVSIDGLSAYGAPIICPWAKIKRMTKESMYKIKVDTSCGSRGGNDIPPIRLR